MDSSRRLRITTTAEGSSCRSPRDADEHPSKQSGVAKGLLLLVYGIKLGNQGRAFDIGSIMFLIRESEAAAHAVVPLTS